MSTLESAAEDLDSAEKIEAFAVSDSGDGKVSASSSGDLQPGSYSLRVDRLASHQSNVSASFASDFAGVAGSGELELPLVATMRLASSTTQPTLWRVSLPKSNDSGARVSANVVFDGTNYQLLVNGQGTGSDGVVSFNEVGGDLNLSDAGSLLQAAEDASFTLNGISITRSSNEVSDVIAGVTLSLSEVHEAGDRDSLIQIAGDSGALKEKVDTFIRSFQRCFPIDFDDTHQHRGVDSFVTRGRWDFAGLQRRLSSLISQGYDHNGSTVSLGMFGIEVQSNGVLSLNESAFDEAIKNNPEGFTSLFAAEGASSLSTLVKDMTEEYTQSGTGVLTTRQDSLRDFIEELDGRIERVESKASSLEERLRKQFGALDSLMTQMQSQSNYLASLFQTPGG